MSKKFVFVDYENVQPKNFEPLRHPDFHIRVFIGAKQKTVATKIAAALQPLGNNAEYICISGNGKNALDFHIAFYTGHFSSIGKDASFYIISKDKGFDPLVQHLKMTGTSAQRVADINKIPVLKSFTSSTLHSKVEKIFLHLKSRGNAVPKTELTLRNSINALFGSVLEDAELTSIIERLKKLGFLNIDGGKVRYSLRQPTVIR